jgi:ParB family chromosome partitioning protein
VEAGSIAPRTAYELTKIEDPVEQAEAAREAAAGLLKRDEAARLASKPTKSKGGKASKARPRKVTNRTFRGSTGYRVTVEFRRGIDPAGLVATLREFLERVEAEIRNDDHAAA